MNIKDWVLRNLTKQDVVFNGDSVAFILSQADRVNNEEIRFKKVKSKLAFQEKAKMVDMITEAKWKIMNLVADIQELTTKKEYQDEVVEQEMDKLKQDKVNDEMDD